jgi:hypothetical protein
VLEETLLITICIDIGMQPSTACENCMGLSCWKTVDGYTLQLEIRFHIEKFILKELGEVEGKGAISC